MPPKRLDWMDGPWEIRVHSANSSSYGSLHLEQRLYPDWIISYVKEGDVTTVMGGEKYRVRAGEVMLHPPDLPFGEFNDGGGVHLWMHARILCAHQLDLLQLARVAPVIAVGDPGRFEAGFYKLMSIWKSRETPLRKLKLFSAAMQLMEQVLSGWERAGFPERSPALDGQGDRFARLIGQMALRLSEKLSREDLAALVRLNANYMDRAFLKQYGLTPMQMLRSMRLNRSKQLLEQGEDSLDAIALQCGMTDASYLCKQFRKQFGLLPGEYRERVRRARDEDVYKDAKESGRENERGSPLTDQV
jgi:AraC-like DNA-binding protein